MNRIMRSLKKQRQNVSCFAYNNTMSDTVYYAENNFHLISAWRMAVFHVRTAIMGKSDVLGCKRSFCSATLLFMGQAV